MRDSKYNIFFFNQLKDLHKFIFIFRSTVKDVSHIIYLFIFSTTYVISLCTYHV